MHAVPGMQSVSNWQEAKAGVEVRQRMVTTIRLRIVVALLEGRRRVRREWQRDAYQAKALGGKSGARYST